MITAIRWHTFCTRTSRRRRIWNAAAAPPPRCRQRTCVCPGPVVLAQFPLLNQVTQRKALEVQTVLQQSCITFNAVDIGHHRLDLHRQNVKRVLSEKHQSYFIYLANSTDLNARCLSLRGSKLKSLHRKKPSARPSSSTGWGE